MAPRRKHQLLGLSAVIVLLWMVYLWGSRHAHEAEQARAADARSTPHVSAREAQAVATRPSASTAPARLSMPALRSADLIAAVSVDKPRVCVGESFLVSIQGKPENAQASVPIGELNFNVDGTFGSEIALSPRAPGSEQYTVVASNGVDKIEHRSFSVEVLPSDAQECAGRPIATLAVERAKHRPDQIVARVLAQRGLDEPVHYSWKFGDGTEQQTSEPLATHDYALRDQGRTLSSYLVSVDARDAHGRHAEGRATIHLINNHYRARMFGARLVQAVYDHFPTPSASEYRVDVTFRSFESEPVVWERATLLERSCLAGQRSQTHALSAAELGATQRLEPGRASQVTLRLPKALVGEDTCAVALELTGDTQPPHTDQTLPGSPIKLRPVSSRISLEIRAAPSAEQGGAPTLARRAVRDPALLKKLRRATQILGSERVTPAQLEELEREGRLEQ
ncbi:MAG TPA: PKD domain-containing protein [Polyangiales bacterium]|nr:PKD domain-containing protein [Polyangiales bacterium]